MSIVVNHIEVNGNLAVEPMIVVREQHIRAVTGENFTLRCDVEAVPEAVRYWKKDNVQLIESDHKFSISVIEDQKIKYKVNS